MLLTRLAGSCALLLALSALLAPIPVRAQEGGPRVADDLLAVITLRGKPCGKVTSYERIAENDYRVSCASGHRYRVFVDAEERVVVEER